MKSVRLGEETVLNQNSLGSETCNETEKFTETFREIRQEVKTFQKLTIKHKIVILMEIQK